MNFNFDEIIDRRGTNSLKYDFMTERGKRENLIPLWIADMDFEVPQAIKNTLIESVEHGIFGYSDTKQEYFNAIYNWYKERFHYDLKEEWLVKTPGIVYALATAINAFTNRGDAVMIQQPVYYPFSDVILNNERKLVNSPLVYQDGRYHIDFEDFEAKIIEEKVKLFILCSPHNPVGRVWSKEELIRLGDICVKHNVIVVSDEIHADFVYEGNQHHIFPSIKPEYLNHCILCTAPSKTFNIAGLQVSNIFIANEQYRLKFQEEMNRTGYSQLNIMGLVACKAAYEHGAAWVDALNLYLADNIKFIKDFLEKHLPQVKLIEPEGTYLLWFDFSDLNLEVEQLEDLIENKANLWLSSGKIFGNESKQFQRMNIACPKSVLEKVFVQLKAAIDAENNSGI